MSFGPEGPGILIKLILYRLHYYILNLMQKEMDINVQYIFPSRTGEKIIDDDDDDYNTDIIFDIKIGDLSCILEYDIYGLTEKRLSKFIESLKNNLVDKIIFIPGSNQESSISTENGTTIFKTLGAGGNNPVTFSIKLPNKYCIYAFDSMLSDLKIK